jgi:uncharacterized protein YabE (DUF348 family)
LRVLSNRRLRRHLSLLLALAAVCAFSYGILPERSVRVFADGREITLQTHESSDAAIIAGAGIDLREGDRVTALEGDEADVLRVDRARTVTLVADGTTYYIRTHAESVDQLLDEAGIVIGDRDSVTRDGVLIANNSPLVISPLAGGGAHTSATVEITVRRAVPFTLNVEGEERLSSTSRPSVALALREAGVTVGPGDAVDPPLDAPITEAARVSVRRARDVTVALPDEHRVLYTLAATVGEALAEAGITVPEGAFTHPSAETPVTSGLSVRVVQLSASSGFEREFIESKTVYRSDESLAPGQTRVVQGHDGALVRRYDVSYVDGDEAGRTLVEEYFDPQPQDTVIYYPVRSGRDVAVPSEGVVGRTLRVYATYYTPESAGRSAADPAYGRTATGATVTYGIVAVDPTVIPLGTKMFIPGYGYAVAADTGGAVKGYIIDLGFPDGVAIDWTPKWLDIYILS